MEVNSRMKNKIDIPPDRTKKIDMNEAFKLRFINKLPETKIAKHFNCSRQAINEALKPFTRIIRNYDVKEVYRLNKADFLEAIEFDLLSLYLDRDKRKKATLGNVGYVHKQINDILRAERGQDTPLIQINNISGDLQGLLQSIQLKKQAITSQITGQPDDDDAQVIDISE